MSVLKSVLFSVLVASSAVITLDAGQKFPPKGPKKTSFKPMATIFEAEPLPKKPKLGPLSTARQTEISGFFELCAAAQVARHSHERTCIVAAYGSPFARPDGNYEQEILRSADGQGLTMLGGAILYNDANKENPAPKFSIRTCRYTAYGPETALLKTLAKILKSGEKPTPCDCHDAPDSDVATGVKLYHVNSDCCSDLLGQQKAELFYRNSSLTCLEKFKAYCDQKKDF